ncbi:MAG: hypothetical protein ACLP5V_02975 [Candidatus Bathyarchaeia archaeon]
MDKTPSLQQIADLIRSLDKPEEKLAVELSAFAGMRWQEARSVQGLWRFPEYKDQIRRSGKIEPVKRTPTSISLDFSGSVRTYRTFLCSEGCGHLYEVLRDTPVGPLLDYINGSPRFRDSELMLYAPVERVEERMWGLEQDSLRQYFCRSLFTAQQAKEADLRNVQIYFMLGEIDGYDYLEAANARDERRIVEHLRGEYARIQGKYFSTARFPKAPDDDKSPTISDAHQDFLDGMMRDLK